MGRRNRGRNLAGRRSGLRHPDLHLVEHARERNGKAAATSLTFAVSADSSPTAQLFPGGNGDVTFYMTNPNAFQITVTNATLDASTPHFASSVANCDNGVSANGSTANPVSFAFASANGTGLTLAPNTTTPQKVTLHNNATMASTADNACQGQTFSATLDVTATQSSGS